MNVYAFETPGLDEFYARTTSRSHGLETCTLFCDGEYVLDLLLGSQVANPSTDRLKPSLAEGLRLGLDGGFTLNHWSITRTRAWGDILKLHDSDQTLYDLILKHTTFYSTAKKRYDPALHISVDVLTMRRSELRSNDFAKRRLIPYQMVDAETEIAGIGPKIDKGGNLAVPIGYGYQQRWDHMGASIQERHALSGAISLRGFPRLLDTPDQDRGRHYQLDFIRLTHTSWRQSLDQAEAWRLSAGYQRLSPGVPGFEIELLLGYGWHHAQNSISGFLAQTGVSQLFDDEQQQVTLSYDHWYALHPQRHHFQLVQESTLAYQYQGKMWDMGVSYGQVQVENEGKLETVTLRGSWHPDWAMGFGVGLRYRLVYAEQVSPSAPTGNRFNASLDWLF